jgi:hypothetical protein
MKQALAIIVEGVCRPYGSDRTRMMDVVIAVQQRLGCVSTEAGGIIAREANCDCVEVESVITFSPAQRRVGAAEREAIP